MSAPEPVTDDLVREAARASEPDRYLAALLAPREASTDLIALAAFLGEVARISLLVNEPMMGELRLQWWRDALTAGREGAATGSPVADALCQAAQRHDLPQELLLAIIDARSAELDPQFPATQMDLDCYLSDTEGAAFRLAGRVLGVPESPAGDDLLRAAGQAYGRVRLLQLRLARGHGLPSERAIGGTGATEPVFGAAKDWLQEARRLMPAAPRALLPAVLPVALVEPYLKVFEGLGPGMARRRADLVPLTRVWRLWLASIRGRI